jgi:hypothetical protein
MDRDSGLQLFADHVHPKVLDDILSWRDDPELAPELGKLASALAAHTSRKSFLDTYAEGMVARHLLKRGYALRFEIPTPLARTADFEVRSGEVLFYLHVKRIDTDRPASRTLRIPSRLRSLERIKRPFIVQVRWVQDATRTHAPACSRCGRFHPAIAHRR